MITPTFAKTETDYRDMMLADAAKMRGLSQHPGSPDAAPYHSHRTASAIAERDSRIPIVMDMLPATRATIANALGISLSMAQILISHIKSKGMIYSSRLPHPHTGKMWHKWIPAAKANDVAKAVDDVLEKPE